MENVEPLPKKKRGNANTRALLKEKSKKFNSFLTKNNSQNQNRNGEERKTLARKGSLRNPSISIAFQLRFSHLQHFFFFTQK